jgi:hypothetical protein
MNATDQLRLLKRIENNLSDAITAARQLPGGDPLTDKLAAAISLASAWRYDQEAEVQPNPTEEDSDD